MRIKALLLVMLYCLLNSNVEAQHKQINLSDMDLSKVYQHLGNPIKNKAVTAEPFQVAGKNYVNGVGVQSNSEIKVLLNKKIFSF